MSLKEKYIKLLADSITVSVEDLSPNELSIITKSFELFQEKMEDLKLVGDDNKRLGIQLANLQSSLDDGDYHYDDDHSDPDHLDNDENK